MSERRALDDIILDVEVAAIHVHVGIAMADEKAWRVSAMAQDEPSVEDEIEAVGCCLNLHEGSQFWVRPASTMKLAPVQPPLSSEPRNSAIFATWLASSRNLS